MLGLVHPDDPTTVMSPYYVEERISPTDKDRARVATLYVAPGPRAAAAAAPPAAPAPCPPPAAAKPPARKLAVQLSTRSTALANALDDEATKGMSAVQRRIKAIEDKMKGK